MGVPTSEVGYTTAMPRREDHEVQKDIWWHWIYTYIYFRSEALKENKRFKIIREPTGQIRAFAHRFRDLQCTSHEERLDHISLNVSQSVKYYELLRTEVVGRSRFYFCYYCWEEINGYKARVNKPQCSVSRMVYRGTPGLQ
jgi:hypothetical protein